MDALKFARLIVRLRKEKGLTQRQVANVLGVSDKSVSKWERGETMPDVALLPVLASFYGVSVDELLSGEAVAGKDFRHEEVAEGSNKPLKKYLIAIAATDTYLLLIFIAWLVAGFFTDNGWKEVAFSLALVIFLAAVITVFMLYERSVKGFKNDKTVRLVTLGHAVLAAAMFIACGGLFDSIAEYLVACFVAVGVIAAFFCYCFKEHKIIKIISRYKIGALLPASITAVLCLFVAFSELIIDNTGVVIKLTVIKAIADFLGLQWSVPFFIVFIVAVSYSAVAVCKNLPCWTVLTMWTVISVFAYIIIGEATKTAVGSYSVHGLSIGIANNFTAQYLIYGNIFFTLTALILYVAQRRSSKSTNTNK